jgi:hypothetical protein
MFILQSTSQGRGIQAIQTDSVSQYLGKAGSVQHQVGYEDELAHPEFSALH